LVMCVQQNKEIFDEKGLLWLYLQECQYGL